MSYFTEEALRKFNEMCAEGIDFGESSVYDFARCVRPDGTAYGTSGQCKKGQEKGKSSPQKSAALRDLEQAKAKRDRIKHLMLTTKNKKARGIMSLSYLAAVAAVKLAERKVGSMK